MLLLIRILPLQQFPRYCFRSITAFPLPASSAIWSDMLSEILAENAENARQVVFWISQHGAKGWKWSIREPALRAEVQEPGRSPDHGRPQASRFDQQAGN